ncbi:MAG: ribbon-helix-helix domain-containing protein, partial [Cypionkella sp.]
MIGPQKHSLTLNGHRTSVTLEPEFWAAFQSLATRRGV